MEQKYQPYGRYSIFLKEIERYNFELISSTENLRFEVLDFSKVSTNYGEPSFYQIISTKISVYTNYKFQHSKHVNFNSQLILWLRYIISTYNTFEQAEFPL